jgi:superfamily I DNA/RNA helicase/RecB family exonuclease
MEMTGFRRAATAGGRGTVLDDSQLAVLALPADASASVAGAPGTGKTTTAIELIADRVTRLGFGTEQVLALTSSRGTASAMRDALARRVAAPAAGPLARTVNSLAFSMVGAAARSAGLPAPTLVTGGEQDSDLASLLETHLQRGIGPEWPESLGPQVRSLRGFRSELRELMSRATEYGVSPSRLRALGVERDRQEWVAAAAVIEDYLASLSVNPYRSQQMDSAELIQFAIAAMGRGEAGRLADDLRLIVVDDLQEATRSTLDLLAAFTARGVAVVAFGDPDVAANAFRGGESGALSALERLLGVPVERLRLHLAHRQGPALRSLTSRVIERIGVAGTAGQRAAGAAGEDAAEPVLRILAESPARQWAAVSRQLRERHLLDGVGWERMAVVLRSGAQVPAAARALALSEVPTRTSVGGTAVRDDPAARALVAVVDAGTGRRALDAASASELLLGPFGGLDAVGLRRLTLALRTEELAGGGRRTGGELLVDALAHPGRFATIDHRVGRSADRLAMTLDAVRIADAEGATIEDLLWLAWQRSGLATGWRAQALGAGIMADQANRDLDGVVALFAAAQRFVERRPGHSAKEFLADLLDSEVPEDRLAPVATADRVLVTTPSGVVGLEVDVVVVAGLQEGVWPNPRLRGSLLHPQQLVRELTGLGGATIDERRQVRDDELRMFALAVSRASRQVILAAVANEDETPSVLLSFAQDAPLVESSRLRPLTMRGLTGRLRRELTSPGRSSGELRAAASALSRLAEEEVPGADPAQWHGLLGPSTEEALYAEGESVPVSPSRVETFEESPLDWFVGSIAGGTPSTAMALGTIVHWAMETATDPTVDAVWRGIEERWGELAFESPWFARQQERAARALAAAVGEYLADFERAGSSLVSAEGRFTIDVGPARVKGSIDRVERAADGSVVIVDLKTGRPVTSQKAIDAHPQLGAYQLAYVHGVLDEFFDGLGEHRAGGAKLLFVKKGVGGKPYREAVQPALDEEALEAFRTRIRQAAIGMAAASFEGEVELDEFGGFDLRERRLHRVRAVSSD